MSRFSEGTIRRVSASQSRARMREGLSFMFGELRGLKASLRERVDDLEIMAESQKLSSASFDRFAV